MGSSGDHTPFTLHSVFLLTAARRRGCSVLWNHTMSKFSRERMAGQPQRPLCDHLSLITCSSFSVGNTDSATLQGGTALLLSALHSLGNLTSFLFMIWECGSIFFLKYGIYWADHCPGLGLHWWHSTTSFLFAEDMWRVAPETLMSEEDSCRMGCVYIWTSSVSSQSFSPYPPQQSLPISFPHV